MMYKRSEIAEIIGISERTLRRLIIREKLPIAKNTRLTRKDIETLDFKLKTQILRYLR
jgi:DNA-binding transcriptional regulator LsrR (DeoR family)